MTDLITDLLQQAKNKGIISRVDVLIRFLRIKHKLTTTKTVLARRISRVKNAN